MNCIIIDDEPYALEILEHYIGQTPGLQLKASFRNAVEAFEYLSRHTVDLLFLDIEMPLVNGIDLLKALPAPPRTIFTTAYKQYAFEGYELDIVDYLLKPFSFERFLKVVQKAGMERQPVKPGFLPGSLLMKDKQGAVHFRQDEIIYIEGSRDYIRIFTGNGPHIFYHTLKGILERINRHIFIRVHRSYIVNRLHINAVQENKLILTGKLVIPVGKLYRRDLISALNRQDN